MSLISYWIFLTRALLTSAPWELISRQLAQNPPIDLSFEPYSWGAHFLAYLFLGFLIQLNTDRINKTYWALLALALTHGTLCEYFQSFVPGRWPNIWDAVANSIALMFFIGYGLRFQKGSRPKIHPS